MRDTGLAVLSPGATFQRRYRVIRCVRAGGMGVVYEVRDERVDAPAALKLMLPAVVDDPAMRARFAQEARITGGIESEHIVRTMDAGVDAETGAPFLVMELLRGEDLGARLAERGPLSPREVVTYLFQAALALDRTHAAGVVHRDLKPENLFLTRRDDGSPCLKLLDFGVAKVLGQGGRTTRPMGTPLYMPPEQATGKGAVGPRADVYALGNIAYTLLSGEAYWAEEWRASEAPLAFLAEVARGVREPASARARRRGVELPAAFDGWFLRATAAHPDDRWGSAGEAAEALAGALDVPLPRSSHVDDEPWGPAGELPLRSTDPGRGSFDTEPAPGSFTGDRTERRPSDTPPEAALGAGATREPGATGDPVSNEPQPRKVRQSRRAIALGAGVMGVMGVIAMGTVAGIHVAGRPRGTQAAQYALPPTQSVPPRAPSDPPRAPSDTPRAPSAPLTPQDAPPPAPPEASSSSSAVPAPLASTRAASTSSARKPPAGPPRKPAPSPAPAPSTPAPEGFY